MTNFTHINELYHTYEFITWHIWICNMTHSSRFCATHEYLPRAYPSSSCVSLGCLEPVLFVREACVCVYIASFTSVCMCSHPPPVSTQAVWNLVCYCYVWIAHVWSTLVIHTCVSRCHSYVSPWSFICVTLIRITPPVSPLTHTCVSRCHSYVSSWSFISVTLIWIALCVTLVIHTCVSRCHSCVCHLGHSYVSHWSESLVCVTLVIHMSRVSQ